MKNRTRIAWTFLAPMLILMVLVAGWPLARSIWFSFTDTNKIGRASCRERVSSPV